MSKRLVLMVMVLALVAPAGAQARHRRTQHASKGTAKTIQVRTEYTEPASQFGGFECRGLETPQPSVRTCQGHFVGPATFDGTMYGDVWYDMSGWMDVDGRAYYEGPDYVTGGVRGCGTGSYIIDDYDGWIDFTRYDPVTNSAPGFNRWRLRPGSGTGELKDLVSGEGVNHWRMYFGNAVGLDEHFGRGLFTGTMTCKV